MGKDQIVSSSLSSERSFLSEDEVFSPVVKVWRRVPRHRKKKVGASREMIESLATPGYIFVRTSDPAILADLITFKHVLGVLYLGNCTYASDEEIQNLKDHCEEVSSIADGNKAKNQTVLDKFDPKSLVGKIVRAQEGLFEDYEGKVKSTKNGKLVVDFGGLDLLMDAGSLVEAT